MFNLSTITTAVYAIPESTGWTIVAGLALACIVMGAIIVRSIVDGHAE